MVNLSELENSSLSFPRLTFADLTLMSHSPSHETQHATTVETTPHAEAAVGYWVESGRYWKEHDRFTHQTLHDIDAPWLATLPELVFA